MLVADLMRRVPIDDIQDVKHLLHSAKLETLLDAASRVRDQGHGQRITYSRKVFIPLTQLCRDRCGYCTFAHAPTLGTRAFMTEKQVLDVARRGVEMGCHEALFTLGDRPEKRWKVARDELAELGFKSTVDYVTHIAGKVLSETGLLPHINCGVLGEAEMAALRGVSASQGLMIEQTSNRLLERGEAHWSAPDKVPTRRLKVVDLAGKLRVPFTTGALIGIGETLQERADTLLCMGLLGRQEQVQEIIIQNFRAKPDTLMAGAPEPDLEEFLRAIAVTRLCLGPGANLQAPPNLAPVHYRYLLRAGINDFGGVSPVTIDYVNPEAPWPHLDELEQICAEEGFQLCERLAVYPRYLADLETASTWLHSTVLRHTLRQADSEGLAREDAWYPGAVAPIPAPEVHAPIIRREIAAVFSRVEQGHRLEESEIAMLFTARGAEYDQLCSLADDERRLRSGDAITFAVNRNINYTNICYFKCQFCAFSKGKLAENLRGKPYRLGIEEVVDRVREARDRGATEVCMQGGIHPDYTGDFYLELLSAVKEAIPEMHVHAFSPLEVFQGARTSGRSIEAMLIALKAAGLGSLPGTAAEVLDQRVRKIICPDKLSTDEWVEVVSAAHRVGIRTTSTLMYGHIDGPVHWARHLMVLRDLQDQTGGFTEFVPLPFVHMEAPMYLKGRARRGPTFEEAIKVHAVARLALRGSIDNIQCSWVKLGREGCLTALRAGCNDFGGTLMN
ncbi:MAG: 5-amino-6-(D-ribitylamino)uracil--L-tyrosine 4-hydroxyphenyl transferase CofH, partial [Chloroflexota bacterium]